VPEMQMTFAEMTPDLKRSISHRGKAFANLLQKLPDLEE
ncbi:MAG: non-canonical purine NTP pyrophosphatase, partial [Mastigocladus sp. ERB_26_1]